MQIKNIRFYQMSTPLNVVPCQSVSTSKNDLNKRKQSLNEPFKKSNDNFEKYLDEALVKQKSK